MDPTRTKHIVEACLLVAGAPLGVPQIEALFEQDDERPTRDAIREALVALAGDYEDRGIELVEVAGGWRLQSRIEMQPWTQRLFREKAPRYSRALLETLVLVAYRQPITRGEIEEVRGVAVSSNIVRTLQERQWVREVGYKDVPGKPALLGTTRQFLDYFNLKRLEDLPTLGALKDLDAFDAVLAGTGLVDGVDGAAANDAGSQGEPSAVVPDAPDVEDVVDGAARGTVESEPEPEPEPEPVGRDEPERSRDGMPDVGPDTGADDRPAGPDGREGPGERSVERAYEDPLEAFHRVVGRAADRFAGEHREDPARRTPAVEPGHADDARRASEEPTEALPAELPDRKDRVP